MADLDVRELVVVIRQNADCARLLQLDDVWTSMAATARPDASDDLAVIVEEMKPLIYRVAEQSGPVHEIAEEHVEILDAAVRELLSSDHLTDADRTDLLWLLRRRRRDSVAEILQGAAQALADPDTEAHELDAQLRAIGEGQVVAGDLSKKFRCGLSLSLIGGSIVTLPGAAAAGFGVMAVGGAAAGVTGMFLTGGVGGIALLAAGLIVARRNGCRSRARGSAHSSRPFPLLRPRGPASLRRGATVAIPGTVPFNTRAHMPAWLMRRSGKVGVRPAAALIPGLLDACTTLLGDGPRCPARGRSARDTVSFSS